MFTHLHRLSKPIPSSPSLRGPCPNVQDHYFTKGLTFTYCLCKFTKLTILAKNDPAWTTRNIRARKVVIVFIEDQSTPIMNACTKKFFPHFLLHVQARHQYRPGPNRKRIWPYQSLKYGLKTVKFALKLSKLGFSSRTPVILRCQVCIGLYRRRVASPWKFFN